MRHACPETYVPCKEGCEDGPCAIQMATVPHPDSLEGKREELGERWLELKRELWTALHLDQMIDWLKGWRP